MKTDSRHPFPSECGETTIEVLYQTGDPAFVCGAHGPVTSKMINDIEWDFDGNPGEGFDRGDGIYLFIPRWIKPQIGDEGRIELPGYWDLEEVGFKEIGREVEISTPPPSPEQGEQRSVLVCPQCGKSDMVFVTVQASTSGDRFVYDCGRCYREVFSELCERQNKDENPPHISLQSVEDRIRLIRMSVEQGQCDPEAADQEISSLLSCLSDL